MKNLKLNNLKSGMLLKITEPYLIERYNESLKIIMDKETKLTEFHIDAVGYSPEINEELGMENYLNVEDINQHFIILTIDQRNLPILNSAFTNKRYMFSEFITDNEEAIINITMKTSLYGEIEDEILKVNNIEDIINLEHITFEISTPKKLSEGSKEIVNNISKIQKNNELIFNEEFINKTINKIQEVGNPLKHNYIIENKKYDMKSFYTRHLNGIYIMRYQNKSKMTIIQQDGKQKELKDYPKVKYVNFDIQSIYDFIIKNKFGELFNADFYTKYTNNIENKMDMILADYSIEKIGRNIEDMTKVESTKFMIDNYSSLPKIYLELEEVLKLLKSNKLRKSFLNELSIETKFMLIRPVEDMDINNKYLIRHLISNFDEYDFIRMYAFNKQLFFKYYEKQSELKKEYIIKMLLENYVPVRKEIKYYL